jgi:hypothetical protein
MEGGIVSVFGGSSPAPGSPAYQEAYTLGRLLAEAGFAVMTGGYAGTMEATSRGAKEAGGHVIGVTVTDFEENGHRPNSYLTETVTYTRLSDRLVHLVTRCDAAVALRGGIGTLSEVALTWSLLQVGEIGPKPFVLLGEEWGLLLETFYGRGEYISRPHMHLFQVARTPEQVILLLRDWS